MKVSEIPYSRYDIEKLKNALCVFEKAAAAATCAEEVISARKDFIKEFITYNTAVSLANCRFTLNTKNEF